MKTETELKYGDIIELEPPISQQHGKMSMYDRAAQFSPFAALTGYEEAIRETAMIHQKKMELGEAIEREAILE